MASAKLIKALERRGFYLDFPDYDSPEEIILDILKENNPRITLSLPLFLYKISDYTKIISKLNISQRKELGRAILISRKIYSRENIKNNLQEIISQNKIKGKFSKQEFEEYYISFKESTSVFEKAEQENIEKQSKLRINIDLNKNLQTLFSPAKIRILKKIFNHEILTNTELKYYYKSISNINRSVLNPALQNYLKVVEMAKKSVK